MFRVSPAWTSPAGALSRRTLGLGVAATLLLGACSGNFSAGDLFPASPAGGPAQSPSAIGNGRVRAAIILPLSAGANAGVAAVSMRNASELALTEFNSPDLQLLVKDDGGTPQGARAAAEQALAEGAEIILGPLFAQSVAPVGQLARARGVPVIAFSTDANVATRGVYLMSFLPESDVERIVGYATGQGKKAFAGIIPDNAYGTVVEAAFKQALARRNASLVGLQKYPLDRGVMQLTARTIALGAASLDAIFLPDGADSVSTLVAALTANGADPRRIQLLGSGLWEDPQIFSNPALEGAWYAGPDTSGFRNFSVRYRARFGQDPARTASLAYDAVALIAALTKTQGPQRFSEATLTNASGFTGIDGLFRFRPDGSTQRGLAVMRVSPTGGQTLSSSPRTFVGGGI